MSCCSDTLTGLAVRASTVSPNTPFIISVGDETSDSITVTITVDETGYYLLRLWLIDASTTPGELSAVPPDGDTETLWYEVTNSSGVLTKTFTHSGTGTWYLAGVVLGPVGVSSAITFA